MPRKFGSVNVEMWNDPEFRKLPPAAQHLYLLLWTAPDLSFCGVKDWRPGRLTKLSSGFTEDHTRTVANGLAARHFLVIDEDTEEVLVRSWARFDELLKQPRLAISYIHAYAAVYSPTLRQVLVHETKKMRELWPNLACWGDSRVTTILDHDSISAKELPVPEDPFGDGFDPGFALGLAQTQGKVWASVCPPPTPAPTPTPNTFVGAAADAPPKSKPMKALPNDWAPTEAHATFADENLLRLNAEADAFRDHHLAKGSRMKDWDAAFRNWMRNSIKFRREQPQKPRHLTTVDEIAEPPDGMNPQEYDVWLQNELAKRGRA